MEESMPYPDLGTPRQHPAAPSHRWHRDVASRALVLLGHAQHGDHNYESAAAVSVQPDRLGRIAFAHATARLTAAQCRAIQLRDSDGHPRHGTARLADRSTEAVRDLGRRGLHRHQTALTAAPDPA
jgi:hypothetical protein